MRVRKRPNGLKTLILTVLLVAWIQLQSACSKKTETNRSDSSVIVAVVGSDTIRLSDFEEFGRLQGMTLSDLYKESVRKQLIDQIIYNGLVKQFAVGTGLVNDPRVVHNRVTAGQDIISAKVRQHEVFDPLITDSAAVAQYERMSEEIRTQHLLIGYRETAVRRGKWVDSQVARRSKARARELVDSIHAVLLKFPNRLGEFVTRFSDDEDTRYLDGDLGYLQFGTVPASFWEKLWVLKIGDISRPIETARGYHIVRIVDRRLVPNRKSFDEVKEQIKTSLAGRYLSELPGFEAAKTAFENKLLNEYAYKPDLSAINRFLLRYDRIKKPADLPGAFGEMESNDNLAIFAGGRIAVQELIWEMENNKTKIRLDADRMLVGLRRIAVTRVVTDYGHKKGYGLSPADTSLLDRIGTDAAVELAHRTRVESMIIQDEPTLRQFYETRKGDYNSSGVIDCMEIYGPDSASIYGFYSEIVQSGNFDATYAQASVEPGFKCRRTGAIPESAIEDFRMVTSGMKTGDVSRPFRRSQGGYAIIRLMSRTPGTVRHYEEVRDDVRDDYFKSERKRRMSEWMEELRVKYSVRIYEDVLNNRFRITQD